MVEFHIYIYSGEKKLIITLRLWVLVFQILNSKLLGYDLDLENFVEKDIIENKTVYYASSFNEKKYVPNFLIEKDLVVHDIKTLLNGLKLVGDYLDKTILKPNNLNYPNSRLLFLDSFK